VVAQPRVIPPCVLSHDSPHRRPRPGNRRRFGTGDAFGESSEMWLLNAMKWLASTQWSIALHESIYGYPIVESIHVWALCVFVGMAIVLDLRLTGLSFTKIPVSEVARRILPWTTFGFVVMVISGVLLFYALPVRSYQNIFFRA